VLDSRLVASEPDRIRANLVARRADDATIASVDRITALASERNALVQERDDRRSARNTISAEIGALMKQGLRDQAESKKAEVGANNARIAVIETTLGDVESELRDLCLRLPNLLDDSVPVGGGEDDNVVVKTWGTPPTFDFKPKSHVDLGEALGILDLGRAAKLAGARFSVLIGKGARLERALINFFVDTHTEEHGYTEILAPYIVWGSVAEGTGQLPKFAADMFKLAEPLNGQDAYLIPTAEVPVTNLYREEILDESDLPKRFAAFSPCFRSEAGSAGRDTRGILRVHQFHKVEMVWFSTPEASADAHEQLTRHAEQCLEKLGLPYRRMLLCSADIGFGATKCHDLEVWLPSQERYREVSSCSNYGDFQARRMDLRYRPTEAGKGKTRFPHTLNGSGLAVGRTLLAILENYQQADGSIVVPEVLRPYMGVDVIR
jgi:seryl-tRNA synthetase